MNKISIIFENEEILLVNKESGVAVQGGEGVAHPLDAELSKQVGYKIYPVHRLDKETAGILIVAKSSAAASKWTQLIQSDSVAKEYTAVCVGIPQSNGKPKLNGTLTGTVEAHGRTQTAVTHYEVTKTFDANVAVEKDGKIEEKTVKLSVLRITLGTGRMHQIRIQMAKAGCPLVADDKHGDFKANKILRKIGAKKLHLAATRLTIPIDGYNKTFEIPLPFHMENTLGMC